MLDALERPPFKLSHHRLCSLHFEDDAYCDPPNKNKLKPYALPSLFQNQQGELVRVKIDPEIEKLVSLKAAGIKVEADEFLKQVIRETELSHSTAEELRLLPLKKSKLGDQTAVKTEIPEISFGSEILEGYPLPNNCSIREKDGVTDYANMCKIETFEFVPAESFQTIKVDPDVEEVQLSSPDVKPGIQADSDDDVICVTDIDPLQTDEFQGYEFSNSTIDTQLETTVKYSSLHTTLDIKEETDNDEVVWFTNPVETGDQSHQESDRLNLQISPSPTVPVPNSNVLSYCAIIPSDKAMQTPLELSASTAKAKKMQVVLQKTLVANRNLRERVNAAEKDLKGCVKDPCGSVTLEEYGHYTNTYFRDRTMAKFVLDLLEMDQAAVTPEVIERRRNHSVESKVNSDAEKVLVFGTDKQPNTAKSRRSSFSNKGIVTINIHMTD
nr:unnamed protein product [Callosobruchus analis]